MRRYLPILLIAAVVLLASAATADARGPWARQRSSGLRQRAEMRQPATGYELRRAQLNERYPRYIGGIHVRELDRFGIPPGDHGPRGNGFYATPW
ncbi:MAG TPA: hypothetical protein VMP01_12120 [Pirellulaceae bacterium]|nr:hypothetical protein [Pirellulaceae bacterium]